MNRFYWHYPFKPFNVTQGWGIKNPMYERFGFSEHNGIDAKTWLDVDEYPVYAPFPCKLVQHLDQPQGAGYGVWLQTLDKFDFDDGVNSYMYLWMGHFKEPSKIPVGTELKTGDYIGIGDNSGLSTGPHTHIGPYRSNDEWPVDSVIDQNEANNSFDIMPYASGSYAQDITKLFSLIEMLKKLIELLRSKLNKK